MKTLRDIRFNSHTCTHPRWRERTASMLRRYYERERFPRLIVMVLLLVTGGVGFLASAAMLWLGVRQMWIRYPAAVLVAYTAFIALIRLWAEWERQWIETGRELPELDTKDADHPAPTTKSGWEWLDVATSDLWAIDEGFLPMIVIGVLFGLVTPLFAVIWIAPELLAEALLNVVLVSAFYRRLRSIEGDHWLTTVIRQTWLPALSAIVVLALVGALMQGLAPEARSIGQVWEQVVGRDRM
ncbi:MAG: hypothetical protein HZA88_25610 [Verrucomicrobia bacterium]|nr:hypothetical protein [Verrucomicrobiota bacterium]